MIDAINLTKELIRRPSVTPADAGAMDIVQQALAGLGLDPGGSQPSPLPAARHIFSHVEWQMTGWLADVPAQDAPEGCVWTGAGGLEGRYALPGAFKAYRPFLFG